MIRLDAGTGTTPRSNRQRVSEFNLFYQEAGPWDAAVLLTAATSPTSRSCYSILGSSPRGPTRSRPPR